MSSYLPGLAELFKPYLFGKRIAAKSRTDFLYSEYISLHYSGRDSGGDSSNEVREIICPGPESNRYGPFGTSGF